MSHEPTKKRKQPSDGQSEHKSKKSKGVKFNDQPISVTFQPLDAESHGLVVARTPGTEPPANLSFAAYEKGGRKRKKIHLHSATHPRLEFNAASVSRHVPHGKDKHYIGVFDPEKNSLELIPARPVTVKCALKPIYAKPAGGPDTDAEQATKSYYERRTALGEAFGTKKAKKALHSAALNSVAGPRQDANAQQAAPLTAMTEAVILNAKDAMDVDEPTTKEDLKMLVEGAHPRPTPDLDAEKPADIYKLDSIVPRKDLEKVDVTGWKSAISGGTPIKTPSAFVSHRVIQIAELRDKIKLKALKYLLGLIIFLNAMEKKGKDGSRALPPLAQMKTAMKDIDDATRESIKKELAPDRKLSPWHVNRIILHACAIAIVLDDCVTEVEDLQDDLRLNAKEMRNYYQQLGCAVDAFKDDKSKQVAKLRLPFSLPEVRVRRMIRR